ncbi:RING-H2 finger protein ATL13 [Acorus gramineus]|uniref:RING-H2 finger protein ATL13 n=1 Tax=Acorus gramineus TaxID=55184 RepID=A0AAV9BVA3_ACOGR|nr:RING-H2 finger protein ATL13 [Acorus gramineus]
MDERVGTRRRWMSGGGALGAWGGYLLRPTNRDPEEIDNVTALQGQLQQLFHLHDAGVDQSFIDTLLDFLYKAIIGLKDPFDCAVCLCEKTAADAGDSACHVEVRRKLEPVEWVGQFGEGRRVRRQQERELLGVEEGQGGDPFGLS